MTQPRWPFRTQVTSDIVRDGMGVELVSSDDYVVAEIFRCDADHTVCATTFVQDLPLQALEMLIHRAKRELEPFEDGRPLSSAMPDANGEGTACAPSSQESEPKSSL